jgi:hypothetical protein
LELSGCASSCVAKLIPFVETVHLALLARTVHLSVTLPGEGDAQSGAAPELLGLAGRDLSWIAVSLVSVVSAIVLPVAHPRLRDAPAGAALVL